MVVGTVGFYITQNQYYPGHLIQTNKLRNIILLVNATKPTLHIPSKYLTYNELKNFKLMRLDQNNRSLQLENINFMFHICNMNNTIIFIFTKIVLQLIATNPNISDNEKDLILGVVYSIINFYRGLIVKQIVNDPLCNYESNLTTIQPLRAQIIDMLNVNHPNPQEMTTKIQIFDEQIKKYQQYIYEFARTVEGGADFNTQYLDQIPVNITPNEVMLTTLYMKNKYFFLYNYNSNFIIKKTLDAMVVLFKPLLQSLKDLLPAPRMIDINWQTNNLYGLTQEYVYMLNINDKKTIQTITNKELWSCEQVDFNTKIEQLVNVIITELKNLHITNKIHKPKLKDLLLKYKKLGYTINHHCRSEERRVGKEC